jgi:hypothetical protein
MGTGPIPVLRKYDAILGFWDQSIFANDELFDFKTTSSGRLNNRASYNNPATTFCDKK